MACMRYDEFFISDTEESILNSIGSRGFVALEVFVSQLPNLLIFFDTKDYSLRKLLKNKRTV